MALSVSQERGKEVWLAICACLGTMRRWKRAPRARGCHCRPRRVSARPREGGGEGEGLCSAYWKHSSSWGGLLQTGRVWAGSEHSCHSAHAAHSHSLWSAGKWHFVPWDKCLVRGCGWLWKGIRIKDEGGSEPALRMCVSSLGSRRC